MNKQPQSIQNALQQTPHSSAHSVLNAAYILNQQTDLKLGKSKSDIDIDRKKYKVELHQALIDLYNQCVKKMNEFITEVKNNADLNEYFVKSGTNYQELEQGLKKNLKSIQKIKQSFNQAQTNLFLLKSAFSFFSDYFSKKQFSLLTNFDKAVFILDLEFKLTCCLELLECSLTLPSDITTSPKQDYLQAWKVLKFQICGPAQKVEAGLNYMRRMMGITTSVVLNEDEQKGAFTKVMAFGLSYPHYMISGQDCILRSMNFYRKPTIDLAQKIWNLPQNGLTKEFVKLKMKNIQTNLKIYIPLDQKLPQNIFEYDPCAIQVRVLYNGSIHRPQKNSSCCLGVSSDNSPKEIPTIIIHMHGGGFLALSSRSMQTYTRRWACELEIPVFSIDYRMPPDFRFPVATFDCLKVYSFIVQNISKYFRIQPKKVILAGDSAGGNLVCSLMGLILKYKLKIPDGIFLAYPACDLRRIFSPSRIYSFTDPLLNPSMLLLCLRQYLNNDNKNEQNPLASPVLLTQEFITDQINNKSFPQQWPRTIIQVGAKDPLFDDTLRLINRMCSSNIPCHCQVYQNLSHGFLNLNMIIPQCTKTIDDSIVHLRTLVNQIITI